MPGIRERLSNFKKHMRCFPSRKSSKERNNEPSSSSSGYRSKTHNSYLDISEDTFVDNTSNRNLATSEKTTTITTSLGPQNHKSINKLTKPIIKSTTNTKNLTNLENTTNSLDLSTVSFRSANLDFDSLKPREPLVPGSVAVSDRLKLQSSSLSSKSNTKTSSVKHNDLFHNLNNLPTPSLPPFSKSKKNTPNFTMPEIKALQKGDNSNNVTFDPESLKDVNPPNDGQLEVGTFVKVHGIKKGKLKDLNSWYGVINTEGIPMPPEMITSYGVRINDTFV